ncbi:helix-turn-helix domain-containing protein [Streptomyces sp. 2.9]|uniref:helix-turn-helix domain-containing protein n=1 Tax=Streptomyces tritrimontium TaxID=3406573 RepID=UPI003BB7F44C
MELLSVKEAAALLGVDDSRVRQLLHDGTLQGQRVGGRWLVAGDSARDRKDRGPRSRRPLSARNAWGVLAVLDGHQPVGLSDAEKSRVRTRVRNLLAHGQPAPALLQELLATRAEVRSYRVHSGVLPVLLAAQDVVRGERAPRRRWGRTTSLSAARRSTYIPTVSTGWKPSSAWSVMKSGAMSRSEFPRRRCGRSWPQGPKRLGRATTRPRQ